MKKRSSHTPLNILKMLLIMVVIAVLTGGGKYYYFDKHYETVFQPERFLPENVLFCSRQKNIGPVIDELSKTLLGRTLYSTPYARLALDLDVPLDTVDTIREVQSFFHSAIGRMIFDEFLRDEFTVALLPDHGADSLGTLLRDNLVVFAKSRHHLSLFNPALEAFPGDLDYTSSHYGSYLIHRAVFNGFPVSYTTIGNHVILCFEERTLRRALDRYDARSANLLENFFYRELSATRDGAYLFSYFSFDQLHRQFAALSHKKREGSYDNDWRLQRWKGFTAGALVRKRGASYDRDTVIIYFNKKELDEKTAAFFSVPPEVNGGIAMVPPTSSLYYWTNTFDLKAMWQVYVSESGLTNKTIASIEKRVEMLCGMGFDDVLDLVDNTVHIMLSQPSSADFVPFPNFTLALQLTDEQRADTMFRQLLKNSRIPYVADSYRGVGITFWGKEMQQGLQPVYSIHDKTLYISSSVKTHLNIIDTLMSEENLTKYDNFTKSTSFFREPNNSTVYIQFPQFIDSTEELIQWAGEMLAIQNRTTAYKARKVIHDFLLPLLEGMHIYESAATRSYLSNGRLIIETNIIKDETTH